MPDQRPLFRSFAAGEISPEAFGRIDLDKLQTGLSLCRNFITLPHGPAQNRPGFEYVLETKDSSKESILLPFIYNTDQAYVLEFGDQYMRVHTEGGTVLEAAKNIASVTQGTDTVGVTAHGWLNGDWVYISGVVGMVELNGRYFKVDNKTADTFTLQDLSDTDVLLSNFTAYVSGGTVSRVYEIATPYLEADLFDLHYTQSADVMTLVHPSYQQRQLTRSGATSWALAAINFDPDQVAPTAALVTAPAGTGTVRYRYLVTALKEGDLEESLGSIEATQPVKTVNAFSKANPGVGTTSAVHGFAVDEIVYQTALGGMVELVAGYYRINTVPTTSAYTLKTLAGVPVDTSGYTTYTSGGTVAECGITNNLATAGNSNKVLWTNVAGAVRYNVYKNTNGLFGFIGQGDDGVTGFVDDNITPDTSQSPPEAADPFAAAGDYPGAVGYFEGRRWFAGTDNTPQGLWSTRSGTESNMAKSIPTRDDDGITVRLRAQRADTIRHIVPLTDLLLLTSGGEWRVTAQNSDAITPMTISYRTAGAIGANNAQPVVTSESVVYTQATGGRVREMLYSWEAQGYKSNDISLLASHLFDQHDIKAMTFTRSPHQVVWCVRDDGVLLGATYVPEHKVIGWHQHTTNGLFKSAAAIPEGNEDRLYAIAQRTIGGRTVRYVERMASRQIATLADSFFVDAGLSYSGSATTTIGGLWHLEGETVAILADGASLTQQEVVNGTVTLAAAASKVQVGPPIDAIIGLLPPAIQAPAYGLGLIKNINGVFLRVNQTSGITVGIGFDEDNLREYQQRTDEPYGAPPDPVTTVIEVVIDANWNYDGVVYIKQAHPLPVTILAAALDLVF